MDIAYNSESKFLDIHIAENIKWNVSEIHDHSTIHYNMFNGNNELTRHKEY